MDDLVEIGELENYVRSTCCMLLFLSKGYFRSGCVTPFKAQKPPTDATVWAM